MGILFSGLIPLAILGGLTFAVITGLRSISDKDTDSIEPAEAAKSFALHLGLFVGLISLAIGSIDLFQAFVEERDRLAGSTNDLARGLSLVIVAGPAYALLLRASGRRTDERRALGDAKASRGWSVYLIVALATTLIATLTSIAQIAGDATNAGISVNAAEVVQLLVWLCLWLVHWLWLRPMLGVRGDAHLAIGTVVGLSWFLSGLGAVIYRILEAGYDSVVDQSLAGSFNIMFWLVISVVGAIVWAWHWLVVFNAPTLGSLVGPSSVEGVRRGSPLWFFTVVVVGILPGLIAIIVIVTVMLSGVAIWFVGTNDLGAAEYFRDSPGLTAALFVGVVTWAYHRWELQRHAPNVRNEATRFHDYLVSFVGLVAVVGAVASLVALLIDTVGAAPSLAGSFRSDNALIVIMSVLASGTIVWWRNWNRIEVERTRAPEEESDSFWRKLYLIASFGIGGLVLGVALVWVLFSLLRDLLDGRLGRQTIEDLASPIGWALAVVGGAWYHFGVWQVDRAVLAARPPPPPVVGVEPPPPPAHAAPPGRSSLTVRAATPGDLGEIYTLVLADRGSGRLSAEALARPVASLEQVRHRLPSMMVAVDGHRIVGFATRPSEGGADAQPLLVVAPDRERGVIEQALSNGGG